MAPPAKGRRWYDAEAARRLERVQMAANGSPLTAFHEIRRRECKLPLIRGFPEKTRSVIHEFDAQGFVMDQISRYVDLALRYVFEPALNWVVDHPFISVLIVAVLVLWSARGYRML
jgi:hypothetical protein